MNGSPDPLEKKIRFGCGSVLGAGVGIAFALHGGIGWVGVTLLVFGAALVCGVLATIFGDRFWENMRF